MFTLPTEKKSPWQILCQSFPALKAVWLKSLPIVLLLLAINVAIVAIGIKAVGGIKTIFLYYLAIMTTGAHQEMIVFVLLGLVLMGMWVNAGVIVKVESLLFQHPRNIGRILIGSLLRGLLVLLIGMLVIAIAGILAAIAGHFSTVLGWVVLVGAIIGYFYLGIRLTPLAYLILTGTPVKQAFIQSWALTRGCWWRTLAVLVLIGVVAVVIQFIGKWLVIAVLPSNALPSLALLGFLAIIALGVLATITIWKATAQWLLIHDLRLRKVA